MTYLESQSLDIIFCDDSAPVTGMQKGGQSSEPFEVDDMIGIARVPLKTLIKSKMINQSFDIVTFNGLKNGEVSIKI